MHSTSFATSFAALALLAAIALAPGAHAQEEDAPSPDDTPHITVTGTAATSVVPDQAEIRLGIAVDKPTAQEAWDEDARRVKDVIDAAKTAGIKPQDIASSGVSLFQLHQTVRQPDGSSHDQPQGFRAAHELTIKVAALDRIGALTGTLIGKGADTFGGVSFSVAHPEPLGDKLRGDAMRDARHQAEILAAAAGVKLGRLLSVEPPDRQVPVRPFVRTRSAGPATMDVEPGTQTLSAEVEASWAIE